MESLIREVPTGVFVVMILVLVGMAGVAAAAGWHARQRAALVERMPTSPIAFAHDGYREFEGVVEAIGGEPLRSPLTGSPCCWYHARVERWISRTGNSGHSGWSEVRDVVSSAPFLVRDASGACVVHPHGAEVTARDRSIWTGAREWPDDRNPPRMPITESATGLVQVSGGSDARYRFTEERICAGDPLLVLGEFSSGRFAASDADDEDDAADEDVVADDAVGDTAVDPFDDGAVADRLHARGWEITRAAISQGGGTQPFMFTATPQAAHVAMTAMGSQAALSVALVPLAIAALLIWTRLK
jgi:hypothetical protein